MKCRAAGAICWRAVVLGAYLAGAVVLGGFLCKHVFELSSADDAVSVCIEEVKHDVDDAIGHVLERASSCAVSKLLYVAVGKHAAHLLTLSKFLLEDAEGIKLFEIDACLLQMWRHFSHSVQILGDARDVCPRDHGLGEILSADPSVSFHVVVGELGPGDVIMERLQEQLELFQGDACRILFFAVHVLGECSLR